MLFDLIGKIVTAPIKIVNAGVKVAGACVDISMGDTPQLRKNACDELTDVVEKAIKEIGE